ncbi:unnamed protein product [Cochlearia groenlandica]
MYVICIFLCFNDIDVCIGKSGVFVGRLRNSDIYRNLRAVTGGPELATTVRSMAKDYDLIVVGRDHGMASPDFTGVKEWMELPELGVIGDLLAVRDLKYKLSVLLVQQQQQQIA